MLAQKFLGKLFQEKLIKTEKKDIKEYKEYNVYDNKE